MKRYLQFFPWCILLSVVLVIGCGHSFTPKELMSVAGTVTEGGHTGVIIRTDAGKMMHFSIDHNAEFHPANLCALHGDRIGVTYGVVSNAEGGIKLVATGVRLIRHSHDWDKMKSPVTGIIRRKGPLDRYRVMLDDLHLNIVVRCSPSADRQAVEVGGPFHVGDRVKMYLEEKPSHFQIRTYYTRIEMVQKGPLPVSNPSEEGTVSKVLPGSFMLTPADGTSRQFYRGTATEYLDKAYQRAMANGDLVRIHYFNLLMGDRSVHPVASLIEKL